MYQSSLANQAEASNLHSAVTPGLQPANPFAADVHAGLSGRPKSLPSKYFYDDAGSRLFQRIMRLPEYYLTDCEHDILQADSPAIAAALDNSPRQVVELGPGDGSKTVFLLQALQAAGKLHSYIPIDISAGALRSLQDNLRKVLPDLVFDGRAAEYLPGLAQLQQETQLPRLVLFLGSSIGNFDRNGAERFLKAVRRHMAPGDLLLLGADLKKDPRILIPAYADPTGVTRDFNRNLLLRINRELEADFYPQHFQHYALYNPVLGAMESYLLSTREQSVHIGQLGTTYQFAAWEPVHTEYSFKYSEADLEVMAQAAAFTPLHNWSCKQGWFTDALWAAA